MTGGESPEDFLQMKAIPTGTATATFMISRIQTAIQMPTANAIL